MPRSRASDEALSCALVVNILSLLFTSTTELSVVSVLYHVVTTCLWNSLATILWMFMNKSLVYLHISFPISVYWNMLHSFPRVIVVILVFYVFCWEYKHRVVIVGLITSYFLEKYQNLISRSALVTTFGESVANISADENERQAKRADMAVKVGETYPQSNGGYSNLAVASTTPFGEKILSRQPIPPQSTRSLGVNINKLRRRRHHYEPSVDSTLRDGSAYGNDKEEDVQVDSKILGQFIKSDLQSAQALGDGRPQERNIEKISPQVSSQKKRKAIDLHNTKEDSSDKDSGPHTKKKNFTGNNIFSSSPISLLNRVYNGISAFSRTNSSVSAKRKRNDDGDERDETQPAVKVGQVLSDRLNPEKSKKSSQAVSENLVRNINEELEIIVEAPENRKMRSRPSDTENEPKARKVRKRIETEMLPQSKYLQGLLKKKAEEAATESTAIVLGNQSISGVGRNNARPPLHKRSSSSVSCTVMKFYLSYNECM